MNIIHNHASLNWAHLNYREGVLGTGSPGGEKPSVETEWFTLDKSALDSNAMLIA